MEATPCGVGLSPGNLSEVTAPVPLSDDEERILNEIEEGLYESDPGLAREVAQTTVYTKSLRSLKWSGLAFFAGIVLMVVTLSVSFLLAFVAFLVMLGAAWAIERNARQLGKTGLEQAAQSSRGSRFRSTLGGSGQRIRDLMRERFRRGQRGEV